MKSIKNTLFIAAASVVLLFASCKKSVPKQTQYIPKDATFVFAVNAKNLQDKLDKSKISVDSLIKEALADNHAAPNDIKQWDDIKNSGIKWQSELFVYMQTKGSMMNGQNMVVGAVAAIDDAAKFEAYFKKQQPGADVKKATNYTYASTSGGFSIGWNKEVVAVVNALGSRFSNNGATNNAETQLAAMFAQKETESVAGIPEFRELAGEKADMLVWTNSSASLSAVPMLGLTKAADLFKDCYGAVTVNFEDGKITGNYTSYLGKVLADILKKHAGPTIDMGALEQYPSNNIDGFISVAFKTEAILDVVKYIGVDGMANQYLSTIGFTLDDALKAFKGDITAVFSDFSIEEKPNEFYPEYKIKTPVFKLIVNSKTGDKAAFTKVANALAQKGILVQQGNQYVPATPTGAFKVTADEKNLFVASDSLILQQYKAGTGKAAIADDVKSKIKGKAAAFYVDINKILKAMPADSAYAPVMTLAIASFKDALITGDNFDGKKGKGYMELRTGNDKENSLATLVKFIKAVADHAKLRHPAIDDMDVITDSTAISTVPDVMVDTVAPVEDVRPRKKK
jgi:hypothetical protein